MKILMLDCDGVLNSQRSAIAFEGYPMSTNDLNRLDRVAVGLIQKLCEETGCKIVLSSSWRFNKDWDKLGEKLQLPIIDRTSVVQMGSSRGAEIDEWLKEYSVEKYAIVDDIDEFTEEQHKYFVQTDPKNGLLYDDYMALREILK